MSEGFGTEFLGNKTSLLPAISRIVRSEVPTGATVADTFSGTATVSASLRGAGFRVHANDHLPLCAVWARARLLAPHRPAFRGLGPVLGPMGSDPLATVIDHLASVQPVEGWVTRQYTPESLSHVGTERKYLTVENGRRVDGVRREISSLRPWLTEAEHSLLLSALVSAVVAVSNVAGTYGCFLKTWKARALRQLHLVPVRSGTGTVAGHRVTSIDAEAAVAETDADLVYADPPYTKRQYAAYYHLLNSLVQEGEPEVAGLTGLPNWQTWASDWCHARRAPEALDRLVGKSAAGTFVLSYSSDGHIPHDVIVGTLERYGHVKVTEIERKRYRSSRLDHKATSVVERIYVMSR